MWATHPILLKCCQEIATHLDRCVFLEDKTQTKRKRRRQRATTSTGTAVSLQAHTAQQLQVVLPTPLYKLLTRSPYFLQMIRLSAVVKVCGVGGEEEGRRFSRGRHCCRSDVETHTSIISQTAVWPSDSHRPMWLVVNPSSACMFSSFASSSWGWVVRWRCWRGRRTNWHGAILCRDVDIGVRRYRGSVCGLVAVCQRKRIFFFFFF